MKLIQLNRNYIFLFITLLFVVFLRMADINFWDGRYLWAEDGNTFLNSAYSLGLNSIFEPYAGYLHLYPRIVTLFAIQFPLSFIPSIFFIFWFMSVIFTSFIVFNFLFKNTNNRYVSLLIPIFMLIQPHGGETFFTVTNAQWFLAVGLFIVIIDKEYKININNFILILLLGLTGPFSILLLPILFLNVFIKKDLKENFLKYSLIILTSLIQIYFMFHSNRVGGNIDMNILDWFKSFYIFFTFGTKNIFAILSLIVWLILFVYTIKFFCDICKKQFDENQINGFLILIGLFIIYFAGLWSSKEFPLNLHPLGGGARYFVIPYILLLIIIPLFIKHIRILYVILFLIFIIDVKQFVKIDRVSLNFQSFAWLSQYTQNLIIPIHPQWGLSYPEWHIAINSKVSSKNVNIYLIKLLDVKVLNATIENGLIKSTNNDLQFIISLPDECKNSKYIGFETKINREKNGWSQVFYTDSANGFSEEKSLKRFYNAGEVTMQFAFENKNINSIRFDPTEKIDIVNVNEIKIYCE